MQLLFYNILFLKVFFLYKEEITSKIAPLVPYVFQISISDTPKKGEVKIHKKARFDDGENKSSLSELACTPEKVINVEQPETPPSVR